MCYNEIRTNSLRESCFHSMWNTVHLLVPHDKHENFQTHMCMCVIDTLNFSWLLNLFPSLQLMVLFPHSFCLMAHSHWLAHCHCTPISLQHWVLLHNVWDVSGVVSFLGSCTVSHPSNALLKGHWEIWQWPMLSLMSSNEWWFCFVFVRSMTQEYLGTDGVHLVLAKQHPPFLFQHQLQPLVWGGIQFLQSFELQGQLQLW